MGKMKKTYYESDEDGTYFEFVLKNGKSGVIDTRNNFREVPEDMKDLSIQEIIKKYGEGEVLKKPMNPEM